MQQPRPPARWAALALLVAVANLLTCPAAAHASGDAAGAQTSGHTAAGAAARSASASQVASQAASQPASHAAPSAAPVASTPAPAALRQTLPTRFYAPLAGTAPKRTGVLLIGGSEGQLLMADEIGPQLAAAGFASLGVRYHDGWSGSAKLTQIPIEQFLAAAQALRAQAGVAQVVVVGDSRGSEAAMLAGLATSQSPGFATLHEPLHVPLPVPLPPPAPALGGVQEPLQGRLQASVQAQASGIAGVVGYVPSSHVWSGIGGPNGVAIPSWSWRGQALAVVPPIVVSRYDASYFTQALDAAPARAREAAALPIEHLRMPLLLLGTDDDKVWPSGAFARHLARRAPLGAPVLVRVYAQAGHRLIGTGASAPSETYAWSGGSHTAHYGGTAAGNLAARTDAWAQLLRFLNAIDAGEVPSLAQ